MNFKKYILFFLVILLLNNTQAQDTVSISNDTITKNQLLTRKNLVGSGFIVNTAGILFSGYKWWWQGDYHPFQIKYEGMFTNYSYGLDKLGHFYISYLYFNAVYSGMKLGRFNDKASIRTAMFIPFLWALTIEIGDGFSSYAFSPDDLLANSLGITYGYLQLKFPYFQNFNVKWSYFPTDFNKWKNQNLSLSDDYDGHYYWLSCNMKNILPKKISHYWPAYFNLAIGYGAENVSVGSTGEKKRKLVIGIDYNLSAISFKSSNLKSVFRMLDFFKFPAPAYKYVPGKGGSFNSFL